MPREPISISKGSWVKIVNQAGFHPRVSVGDLASVVDTNRAGTSITIELLSGKLKGNMQHCSNNHLEIVWENEGGD